jgi:AcrR family transcriptional regulator
MPSQRRVRPPRRSTQALRHDLLEAARGLFAEKGFAATTTRDVAQRAGTVEPLIYRHFKTKAGLFAAAVFEPLNEALEALMVRLERNLAAAKSVDAQLQDYATSLLQVLRKNRRTMIAFVNAATFHADEFKGGAHAPLPSLIAHLKRLQKIGARHSAGTGVVIADPMMETRLSFALVFAVAVFEELLLEKSERDEARELASIVKLLSVGIGAPVSTARVSMRRHGRNERQGRSGT